MEIISQNEIEGLKKDNVKCGDPSNAHERFKRRLKEDTRLRREVEK
jgi:hypothetical protein